MLRMTGLGYRNQRVNLLIDPDRAEFVVEDQDGKEIAKFDDDARLRTGFSADPLGNVRLEQITPNAGDPKSDPKPGSVSKAVKLLYEAMATDIDELIERRLLAKDPRQRGVDSGPLMMTFYAPDDVHEWLRDFFNRRREEMDRQLTEVIQGGQGRQQAAA